MDITEARSRFAVLRTTPDQCDPDELDAIWAALETVRPEEILGSWRGDEFNTGHASNGHLAEMRWYGKTFNSLLDAKPMITRNAEGELFSNLELGKGEASLWSVEFRGEVTATMVYDGKPVLDHFKKVDDNTLMGIMNGKGALDQGRHFYFLLERD